MLVPFSTSQCALTAVWVKAKATSRNSLASNAGLGMLRQFMCAHGRAELVADLYVRRTRAVHYVPQMEKGLMAAGLVGVASRLDTMGLRDAAVQRKVVRYIAEGGVRPGGEGDYRGGVVRKVVGWWR
jgi:hypothetical protein